MLSEIKNLYNLGVTLLWLHPKSKRPIDTGWTKKERPEWKYFARKYTKTENVGARLGSISKFADGTFLAAIDVDVKSPDEKHRREVMSIKWELLYGKGAQEMAVPTTPITKSGRGNGSCHVWVRTNAPVKPRRLAQSPDKVECHMPSVAPSKHDLDVLGKEKCDAGLRLRAAWEISLMGEGQQIVIPPSIHPDTGAPYEWALEFKSLDQLPLFEDKGAQLDELPKNGQKIEKRPWTPVEFDLDAIKGLDPKVLELLKTGDNCSDRSVGLFEAAEALFKVGCDRDTVLTILSEPGTFLGDACYEHAKTHDRDRAVRWLARYTVDKCEEQFSIQKDFDAIVEVTDNEPPLGEGGENDWRKKLERTPRTEHGPGKIKNTLNNLIIILSNAWGPSLFQLNQFANITYFNAGKIWPERETQEYGDIGLIEIKSLISERYKFEPSSDRISEAVALIANKNGYHPVRNWLKSLPAWDGVERLNTWLADYLGAVGSKEYLAAVSRKLLCALIARVEQPGIKFDYMVILEGLQGAGKSSFIAALVGPDYFSDAKINFGDKDAVMTMQGVWGLEINELGAMKRADIEMVKEFISRQNDRIRLPYGRHVQNFPRQTVLIGTTNQDRYLVDQTGNRRFWPVKITSIDIPGMLRVRDQLFAEAQIVWSLGEPLWLESETFKEQAEQEHELRMEINTFEEAWDTFESTTNFDLEKFTMTEAFSGFGPFAKWQGTTWEFMQAAAVLKRKGYLHKKVWKGKGSYWNWVKK